MSNQRYFNTMANHTGKGGKQMGVINEDDDILDQVTRGGSGMGRNYSNYDHENTINKSGYLGEDSIAEPGRAPRRVEGLSSFLIQEYYKRFGIYCQDADKLFKFWKDHVSENYRQMRERNQAEKAQQGHF